MFRPNDGGLVDNFGLSGISIGILAAQRPYEPMTERQAARVSRMMFVVVDAGRGLSGNWVNSLEGPTGVDLVAAAADTAIDASVRSSYAAFSTLINDWTAKVRRWRCGLSVADRARLELPADWKCNDLNTFIDRVSFDRLGPARAEILDAITTRFVLPSDQVDALIEGGADALRSSAPYQAFRRGFRQCRTDADGFSGCFFLKHAMGRISRIRRDRLELASMVRLNSTH